MSVQRAPRSSRVHNTDMSSILFLATGWEGLMKWNAPYKGRTERNLNNVDYNPLQNYNVPKHFSADTLNAREV